MKQYRIEWMHLNHDAVRGHGEWQDSNDLDLLKENISYYNKQYKGEIHHWLQTK